MAHVKRVSLATKTQRTRAIERGFLTQGAENGIDGNWERGRRTKTSSSDLAYTGELIQGWDDDFATLWDDAINEANLRG